jgi:8-amino-7-oxononanoate synthase
MHLPNRHKLQLQKRTENNSLRTLSVTEDLIDFSSNDYLGLARNEQLKQIILEQSVYANNGATGSRLLTGNSNVAMKAEKFLAQQLSAPKTLIFNSGYCANLAVLSALPQRNDIIYFDELSHASIKDGIRLSLAKKMSFKHNDLNELERKLKKQSTGGKYVVVESIYSMDGDVCDLKLLVKICKQNGAYLIVDEAHATGLMGSKGGGLSEQLGLENDVFCRIYTFGKAMGIHGAAVAGSEQLIQYFVNFARPFIYTTALPDHSYIAIKCAFEYLTENIDLQDKALLQTNLFINLAEQKLKNRFERTLSNHPIQTILISGNNEAKTLSGHLQQHGFDVRPILSPTVKEGQERLRICLHSYNSNEDISALVDTLAAYS